MHSSPQPHPTYERRLERMFNGKEKYFDFRFGITVARAQRREGQKGRSRMTTYQQDPDISYGECLWGRKDRQCLKSRRATTNGREGKGGEVGKNNQQKKGVSMACRCIPTLPARQQQNQGAMLDNVIKRGEGRTESR